MKDDHPVVSILTKDYMRKEAKLKEMVAELIEEILKEERDRAIPGLGRLDLVTQMDKIYKKAGSARRMYKDLNSVGFPPPTDILDDKYLDNPENSTQESETDSDMQD